MSRCRQCRWQRRETDSDTRAECVRHSGRSRRGPSAANFRDRPRSGFHHSNESHLFFLFETIKICNGNVSFSFAKFLFTDEFRIGLIQSRRYVSTFDWKNEFYGELCKVFRAGKKNVFVGWERCWSYTMVQLGRGLSRVKRDKFAWNECERHLDNEVKVEYYYIHLLCDEFSWFQHRRNLKTSMKNVM